MHIAIDSANVKIENGKVTIDLTPEQVAEVKHGNWIYHGCISSYEGAKSGYSCSNCCMIFDEEFFENSIFNYCPNCGARMDSEEGE